MVQDRAITMADQQKVPYDLSNSAVFIFERPITQFPRSDVLTLNSSQTATYGYSYYRRQIGNYIQAFE